MTEEQTPAGVQDPAPAPTPVAAPPNPGPWDNDLAGLGLDDASRATVDAYLRGTIQPRMTQLEQSAAAARQAQTLMDDLVADPNATMEALAAELNWSPQQLQEAVEQQVEAPQATVDPRVEQVVNYVEQMQAQASYEQEMTRQATLHPGLEPELFHPFVSAADGNFDDAYMMYENWVGQWNSTHAPAEQVADAPPTLGGDQGATTPPTQPTETPSLGDAIKSFMADNQLTNTPPPIS